MEAPRVTIRSPDPMGTIDRNVLLTLRQFINIKLGHSFSFAVDFILPLCNRKDTMVMTAALPFPRCQDNLGRISLWWHLGICFDATMTSSIISLTEYKYASPYHNIIKYLQNHNVCIIYSPKYIDTSFFYQFQDSRINPCDGVPCGRKRECVVQNDTPVCVCRTICSGREEPVCGNDGVTYGNLCELHRASCLTGRRLYRVSDRSCTSVSFRGELSDQVTDRHQRDNPAPSSSDNRASQHYQDASLSHDIQGDYLVNSGGHEGYQLSHSDNNEPNHAQVNAESPAEHRHGQHRYDEERSVLHQGAHRNHDVSVPRDHSPQHQAGCDVCDFGVSETLTEKLRKNGRKLRGRVFTPLRNGEREPYDNIAVAVSSPVGTVQVADSDPKTSDQLEASLDYSGNMDLSYYDAESLYDQVLYDTTTRKPYHFQRFLMTRRNHRR